MATLQPLAPSRQTLISQDTKPQITAMPSTRKFQPAENVSIPTRESFTAVDRKRTLPMSPTEEEPSLTFPNRQSLRREGSHRSSNSQVIQDHDTDMISDEEGDPSENDSQDDDTEGPSKKKKKGQRFFCTEYPPCNLSFTRSEHLARHIRKHTGERPFQCHCSRRFSRLDNLRQHAQTVHINEEIPGDSLAATGTRFQRQIRTDRVRPPSARARASTAGSQSGHRGHGRNQSTSSIASTASNVSSVSALSRKNSGRRPHSMNFGDHQRRPGLTIDTLRVSPTHNYPYIAAQQTASGNSTPTSYYVGTPSSPHTSALGSPVVLPRNAISGPWSDRQASSRRLSVPSQPSLFPAGASAPQFHPMATLNSSNSSVLGSPTSSTFSLARTEVGSDDWRRRTWHPNTFSNYSYPRPATSGLSYSQTPNEPRPAFAPQALAAAAPQTTKLPGIETFDQISNAPSTPPQHGQVNVPSNSLTPGRLLPTVDHRRSLGHQRGVHSWDMSLHQNLTRLEITGDTPPRETRTWTQQSTPSDPLQPSSQYTSSQSYFASGHSPGPVTHAQVPPQLILPSQPVEPTVLSSQSSMPSQIQQRPLLPVSQQQNHAPPSVSLASQRGNWSMSVPHKLMRGQSTGEISGTEERYLPSSQIDYQPTIIHANGYIESQLNAPNNHTLFSSYQSASPSRVAEFSRKPDTSGLDALVAVATSESRQLQVQR